MCSFTCEVYFFFHVWNSSFWCLNQKKYESSSLSQSDVILELVRSQSHYIADRRLEHFGRHIVLLAERLERLIEALDRRNEQAASDH